MGAQRTTTGRPMVQGSAPLGGMPEVAPRSLPLPGLPTQPRSGVRPLGWWQAVTAPADTSSEGATYEAQERMRRAHMASGMLLGFLLVALLALGAYTMVDRDHPEAVYFILGVMGAILVAAVCNRLGATTLAACLLMAIVYVPLLAIVLQDDGLNPSHIPVFYLLVVAELIAVSLMSPRSVFVVGALNTLLVPAVLLLVPRSPALVAFLASDDVPSVMGAPMMLQLIVAIVAYVWVNSVAQAVRRAQQAEQQAEAQRQAAEDERAELEEGVRQLLTVHVHLANGDFDARVPRLRQRHLWQVGLSLNTLIARLARLGQIERAFAQEQEDARALAHAIYDLHAGRQPSWPPARGLPIDMVHRALRESEPQR